MEVKEKEVKLLSQYVRKLEEEAKVRDGQRERLLTDASIARSKWNTPLLSKLLFFFIFFWVKANPLDMLEHMYDKPSFFSVVPSAFR